MSGWVEMLFGWLCKAFILTLEASVLIALLFLVQKLFNRWLNIRWQYALWFILLIKLSVPLLPSSPVSLFQFMSFEPRAVVATVQEQVMAVDVSIGNDLPHYPAVDSNAHAEPGQAIVSRHTMLITAAVICWVTGIVFVLSRVISKQIRLALALKHERLAQASVQLECLLEQTKQLMGVPSKIGLQMSNQVGSPTLYGLFRPVILLPQKISAGMEMEQFRHAFLHELSHFKRKDIWINVWFTLLLAVYWFNPFLWYAFHRMRADQELACDAGALTYVSNGECERYAASVVRLLELRSKIDSTFMQVGFSSYYKQMKRRIVMIQLFSKEKYKRWVLGATLVLIVTAISLPSIHAAKQNTGTEREKDALTSTADLSQSIGAIQEPTIAENEEIVEEGIKLQRPVDGGQVTRPFGEYQPHPSSDTKQFHNGVDIVIEEGTPVVASLDGEVIAAGYDVKLGNNITILFNNEWEISYHHLQQIDVEIGDFVKQGQTIGQVGSTGASTGPHLYFSISQGDRFIDPQLMME